MQMRSVQGVSLWTEENCNVLSITYPTEEISDFYVMGDLPSDCRWKISSPEGFDAIFIQIGFTDLSCDDGYLEFTDENGRTIKLLSFKHISLDDKHGSTPGSEMARNEVILLKSVTQVKLSYL